MGMRKAILITVALILAACSERYLPDPLDGGAGGAGGAEPVHVKAASSSEPDACVGPKCQGQWRR